MLERVRALYAAEPERAEMLLEELIIFLRAVLPRLHSATSTVGQEIAAAAAYVRLRALAVARGAPLTTNQQAEGVDQLAAALLDPRREQEERA